MKKSKTQINEAFQIAVAQFNRSKNYWNILYKLLLEIMWAIQS